MKDKKNGKVAMFVVAVNIIVGIMAFLLTGNIPVVILSMLFTCIGLYIVILPDRIRTEQIQKKNSPENTTAD